MENEFITIAEAVRITGKTDVDVMRMLKKKLQATGLPMESIVKREQREKGTMLLISKEFLFQRSVEPSQEAKTEKPFFQARAENGGEPLLQAKDEMIAILQGIIETKDRQMGDLSKKIDELIERDRETNILLRGLQERIFLLEDSHKAPQEKKK